MGLRSIFGRARGLSDADRESFSSREAPQRSGGIRASLAEITTWSSSLHHGQGHRSEVSLAPLRSQPASQSLRHKKSVSGMRPQPDADGPAAWSPPPLYQAYPQAIKHASLPACTAPVEAILRQYQMSNRNNGPLGGVLSQTAAETLGETSGERSERPRRRHRPSLSGTASKFEWTTKVFILVNSGYLLQYAGEGTYDRLPERVLQLGKDSAAFASDAIPGRHWVLQVSSVADADRNPSSHSSLRARFPFRGQERRHCSTMLMVFESAEAMDSWIVTLRREIEALGGRKVLSETGRPKTEEEDPQLRSQASQRTLVVRDSDPFSQIVQFDNPWNQHPAMSSSDNHLASAQEEASCDPSFDDMSTASVISHEGRQLESLRDSTNRLSFISSGQRTTITSAGSSPICSPVRDSFLDLGPPTPEHSRCDELPQPRMRPNALEIIDRRQSLQGMNPVIELDAVSAQSLRPLSTSSGAGQYEVAAPSAPAPQPAPNSNAPHCTGRRYSLTRTAPSGMPSISSPLSPGWMNGRRPPPSALSVNPRPLSFVEDQPSPALSPRSRVETGTERRGSPRSVTPLTPPDAFISPRQIGREKPQCETRGQLSRDLNAPTQETSFATMAHPRRGSSQTPLDGHPQERGASPSPKTRLLDPPDIPRSRPSLGTHGPLPAPTAFRQRMRARRLSFSSQQPGSPRPSTSCDLPHRPATPSSKPVPRSSQQFRRDSQPWSPLQRRSLSQLTEGPPPAPPPSRALPPIPQVSPRANAMPPPGFI